MTKIIKVYEQAIPALRFIGKKHTSPSAWNEWFSNNWFEEIELAAGGEARVHEMFDGADAYIGLIRETKDHFEYWIGEFVPTSVNPPEGFIAIDFPVSKLGVCWIHGPESEIYRYEGNCRKEIEKTMTIIEDEGTWSFERYVCPRFTTPDKDGYVILDYCFFIK